MMEKTCIKSLTLPQLEKRLSDMGQPGYRARQIFKWLHLGAESFDGMSDVPKGLRQQLDELYYISRPEILRKQVSKRDGTIKYLFGLRDGNSIETVLMKYEHGYSICLSTQAGCKMGCVFCASFDPEKSRDLLPGEILDQVIFAQKDSGEKVSNIVLMGTGEPLSNYDNTISFLNIVTDPAGLNIGMRHISLSTCGIVPKIDQLAQLHLQLTLSISLHAPTDEIRSRLMPVNRTYNISSLIKACKRYFDETGRRISFEYAMISGVNDTKECAVKLANLLHGFICHVNLIPLNHVEGSPLKPSSREQIRAFQNELVKRTINATVRRSLGGDIDASCGQLRRRVADNMR